MNIAIVLLKRATKPIGGYKVVYEYANALSRSGDAVEIIYNYEYSLRKRRYLPMFIKKMIYKHMYKSSNRWFELEPTVKERLVWSFDKKDFSKYDVAIATAALTSINVSHLMVPRKLYFIQGFETWDMSVEDLVLTYKYKMKHVVISTWLQRLLQQYNEQSIVIHNGINHEVFYETISQRSREKHTLAYMYHIDPVKGINVGMDVINRLKKLYPDLRVRMFGAYPKGADVPAWVQYTQNASPEYLRDLYNSSQVFLSTSREEGFGLTGAESMACGCALVSTRTRGVLEYATDRENAFLADVDDVEKLVSLVSLAFQEEDLRCSLAAKGREKITNEFDAKASEKLFVQTVHSYCDEKG